MPPILNTYGKNFPKGTTQLQIELWGFRADHKKENGGLGAYGHCRNAMNLIWPNLSWHDWMARRMLSLNTYKTNAWTGCAAAGKTFDAGLFGITFWLADPDDTSVIFTSTTGKMVRKRLVAGTLNLEGGIDSGRAPHTLKPNQCAWAVNTSFRGGFATCRPPLAKTSASLPVTPFDRFQHAAFFDGTGKPMLIAVISGHFFKIDPESYEVTEFTPSKNNTAFTVIDFVVPAVDATVDVNVGVSEAFNLAYPTVTIDGIEWTLTAIVDDTTITLKNLDATIVGNTIPMGTTVHYLADDENPESDRMGWSVQAEHYWIYQNNKSLPLIFDGATARRSDLTKKEVPVGNVIEYGMGRLTVALPDRVSFRMGDLVFGPSGTLAKGFRDAILRFQENDIIAEGGDFIARIFGAPSHSGPIRAIRYIADLNSSLGQGPMMVFTTNTIFSIEAPFDRTIWAQLNSPIQRVTMIDYGATAQETTIGWNSDMWYRSIDGIRSLISAIRYFGQPGNTPMSGEISRILSKDDEWLLEYGSAVIFDNRLLMTVSPVMTEYGVYHRGLAVMDADLISSATGKLPPVWEGVWTGLRILKILKGIVNGKERCWMFTLNIENAIELWELLTSGPADNNGSDKIRINQVLELRSETFDSPMQLKRLDGGAIFLDQIEGLVNVRVLYREDGQNCWREWHSFEVCSTMETCDPLECTVPGNLQPQTRPKIKLPTPPDIWEDASTQKKLTRVGYEFQPRIEITGKCRFRGMRLHAYIEEEFPGYESPS